MAKLGFCRAFFIIFFSLQIISINCTQFEVGGKDGWIVPDSTNSDTFNQWASENRFKINDTIHFKYKDDSVMEVSSSDYSECRSSSPISYGNNGDTVVHLDRPGFFYFISGVSTHCNRGMKMIVKVLEKHDTMGSAPSQSQDYTASSVGRNMIPTVLLTVMMFFFGIVLI